MGVIVRMMVMRVMIVTVIIMAMTVVIVTAAMPVQVGTVTVGVAVAVFVGQQAVDIGLSGIGQASVAVVADPAQTQAGRIGIVVGAGLPF